VLGEHEVALILLGRNVSFYLEKLHAHHRALGVDHMVYVDNGSTDDSLELAARLPGTVVATCSADFRVHQPWIRYHAVTKYVTGGWRLLIDADELFDYPGSERLRVPDLTRRLASRGFTGVIAQMLDLVPPDSLCENLNRCYREAIETCRAYSLGGIEKHDYHRAGLDVSYFLAQNSIASDAIKLHYGGLRRRLFGEDCLLTKHPLIRMARGVVPLPHPHLSTGLACADFTALIRHYKFTGNFLERERSLLRERRITHGETALRVSTFDRRPDLSFSVPDMQYDATVAALLEEGFLVASDDARTMLGIR
jgi:hypothetical protein